MSEPLNNLELWYSMSEKEPAIADLPFVTFSYIYGHEFWEDSDWFQELTEKERLERTEWLTLEKHKNK